MSAAVFLLFVALLIRRWLYRVPKHVYPRIRTPIHPMLRRAVMDRNRGPVGTYSCTYCGRWTHSRRIGPDCLPWALDHRMPWSLGGPDTYDNLVLACWSCNTSKGTDFWG